MTQTELNERMIMMGRTPLFQALPPDVILRLAAGAEERQYAAGEVVIREDDPETTLCFVVSGLVKVTISLMAAKEMLVALLAPGEFFGELAVLDGQPRSATVTALERSNVVELKREAFLKCLEDCPGATLALLVELSRRLRHSDQQLAHLATAPTHTRLLHTLAELGERFGRRTPDGIELRIRMSQQDLAACVGGSREQVNRDLRQLRRDGVVRIVDQRITLLDTDEAALLSTA
ncbi:MAG: Crp/Fnr family transcriptional regulator [Chloroflexi bacterium]|nr:Crp/Fnr family transcriptional regulator [Chloroflexota bacterium]